MTQNQDKSNCNIVSSGIHSFQAFTKVENHICDRYTSDDIYHDLRLYTDLEVLKRVSQPRESHELEFTEDEILSQVRRRFFSSLAIVSYLYILNIDVNEEIAHKLNLLMFSVEYESVTTYLIPEVGNNNCCVLEAYQALVHASVDQNATLINDAEYFIQMMSKEIYDECMLKIKNNA